jgi:heme exporter protein A
VTRPPPSGEALVLEGIAHRFAGRWVLRGCDLAVAGGEAVALVGSNGSGKTTLLRIAATLLRPSRGGGRVLGADLRTDAQAVRRVTGMVSFRAGVYEDLTAAENLVFATRMHGRRPDPDAIARALAEVGLARHAGARVRGFSDGMRRRVALARVLLRPPRVLLLDEPYAALDASGVDLVNRVIHGVVADGGAVLAATHDVERARGVMRRVVRLADGVLHELPSPPALVEAAVGGEAAWR